MSTVEAISAEVASRAERLPLAGRKVLIIVENLPVPFDRRVWQEATTLAASLARGVGDWEHEWREVFMPSVALYLETEPKRRADFIIAGRGLARSEQ